MSTRLKLFLMAALVLFGIFHIVGALMLQAASHAPAAIPASVMQTGD
jgi:hypothetical protein